MFFDIPNTNSTKMYFGESCFEMVFSINDLGNIEILFYYSSPTYAKNDSVARMVFKSIDKMDVNLKLYECERVIKDMGKRIINADECSIDKKKLDAIELGRLYDFGEVKILPCMRNESFVVLSLRSEQVVELITVNPVSGSVDVKSVATAVNFNKAIKYWLSNKLAKYADSLKPKYNTK